MLIFLLYFKSFTQNVKIVDENNSPISGVLLYSTPKFYVSSDIDGMASLDMFSKSDSLTIQQYGFVKEKIIKSSIDKTSLEIKYEIEQIKI